MKTYSPKIGEVAKEWYVVDAEGQTLGRLATRIANALTGKNKPQYAPHVDVGDFVVVVNADKVHLSGKKWDQKWYHRHSGYPGGLYSTSARRMRERFPERIIRNAVKGMLPKNRLQTVRLNKLKIYVGPDHPHKAQQPKPL